MLREQGHGQHGRGGERLVLEQRRRVRALLPGEVHRRGVRRVRQPLQRRQQRRRQLKIVDECASSDGCQSTIDLSKQAFAKIANLDAGEVKVDFNSECVLYTRLRIESSSDSCSFSRVT